MIKTTVLFLCFVSFCGRIRADQRKKLIIDNDAGGDDAMGIFVALLREKYFNGPELVALTTVNGNTKESNVVINNQRILKVAERQEIPIYRGATRSLVYTPASNNYYGFDGLGDTGDDGSGLVEAQDMRAVDALIDLSKKYEGELTVVTLGPLTNIAMAINLDPGFLERLDQLYIAAAHIHSDLQPSPEFNALMDVEAFHVVANASTPLKVTIFPFSQLKLSLNITKEWRQQVLGGIDSEIMRAQNKFESVAMTKYELWTSLDPGTVAMVIDPELVDVYTNYFADIIFCGNDRGIHTFVAEANNSNMRVIDSAKKSEYMQFLLETFNADTKSKNNEKIIASEEISNEPN